MRPIRRRTPLARRVALGALVIGAGCRGEPVTKPDPAAATECVVLLHGLGRSSGSLEPLARRLREAGYAVVNYDYATTRADLDGHASELARRLPEFVDRAAGGTPTGAVPPISKVHFVTHSLGGIVVRKLLAEHTIANLGRVVMLAPPNRGSELADTLREVGILEWSLGPAAVELGTREGDAPRSLGPVAFECGVIAGDVNFNPFGKLIFDGPNDGKVSVDGAKVDGMTDFLVVHHGHTFLMNAKDVQDQVVLFLRTGRFDHAGATIRKAP
jgi:pimeloyl-ACP methyl ester carboxylesterase